MITRFTIRCRSFVWYLIVAFTICSIPHFELLPVELAGLLSNEAYAAQTSSAGSCPVHEYVYDARGRVVTERHFLEHGGVSETCYSYNGFSTTKTDSDGHVKTEIRDYLGRMIRAEEPFEGKVLRMVYTCNAAGDFLSMTDSRGNVTTMAYDSLGQRVSLSDPHTGAWSYAYDSNGNLVKQTDPTGHSVKDKKVGEIAGSPLLNAFTIASIAIAAALLVILIISTIIMLGKEFSSYHDTHWAYEMVGIHAEDATERTIMVNRANGAVCRGMFLKDAAEHMQPVCEAFTKYATAARICLAPRNGKLAGPITDITVHFAATRAILSNYRNLFIASSIAAAGLEALNWSIYLGINFTKKSKETNEEGYGVLTDYPDTYGSNVTMQRSLGQL